MKIVFLVLSWLIAGAGAPGRLHQMPDGTHIPALTAEQWREDLHYLAAELPRRHRDPFHHTSKAAFEAAVTELDARIPTSQPWEIVVGLQQLAAMPGDGHTFVATWGVYQHFPLEVFRYADGWRVVRAAAAYRDVLGLRLRGIGGKSMPEVERRLRALVPQGENRWFVWQNMAGNLTRAEPLAARGVLPAVGPAAFEFEGEDGSRFVRTIAPLPPGTLTDRVDAYPTALFRQRPEEALPFMLLADGKTVYANFRSYDDHERQARRLLAFLNETGARRLILDLRGNGGGNYTLPRKHLIAPLQFHPTLNRAGRLYVLIGRGTFSAAMTNATDFRRETEAILVGEPTGARPNGYQELYSFSLPHSRLTVCCAILRYRFQEGKADAVHPDWRIEPNARALREGDDPVIRRILSEPIP
ncbi:MAG: hypothetical protein SFU56_08250 [Capsulimonadales bacterium]|nr:hypothetical protein [Capsulimonadales bacterium]